MPIAYTPESLRDFILDRIEGNVKWKVEST
jgi:hypothetical protein